MKAKNIANVRGVEAFIAEEVKAFQHGPSPRADCLEEGRAGAERQLWKRVLEIIATDGDRNGTVSAELAQAALETTKLELCRFGW